MLTATIVFLTDDVKPMAIKINVEEIESGSIPNSHRFKILDNYNDLSEESLKKIDYYIKNSFFSSGTLYINDKVFLGTLSISTEKKVLAIILGEEDTYYSVQEANYILDIRKS
jgi:hypothetical protein